MAATLEIIPRRRRLLLALALLAVAGAAMPLLVGAVGGAWEREPGDLEADLGPAARDLLDRAMEGLEPGARFDYHTHLVGLGTNGSGCFVHPGMRSWWHLTRRVQFAVYRSASGIEDDTDADAQYVARLRDLVAHAPDGGRHLLLAFDRHYTPDGKPDPERTEFFTPNDYAFRVAEGYPDRFVAALSVHPDRPDANAELERGARAGGRIVKWLPNAMGIDPSAERHDAFYAAMKRHGLVLLSHAGEEKAVESEEDQRFGNPLLLRRPLDLGVKVIVAHCASLGESADLDHPGRPARANFDLFLRLMDEPRYEGLVFGEISAMTQRNRIPGPLRTLLRRTDLHPRLVNGSDYPLPAINVLISTGKLVDEGFLTEAERDALNEIYDFNPLLFDFVLKRTLRGPGGERFPASVFREHPELPAR